MCVAWCYGHAGGIPKAKHCWQVLLNHHLTVQARIPGQIGDTEAARTEHALDDELFQPCSGGECLAVGSDCIHSNEKLRNKGEYIEEVLAISSSSDNDENNK